MNAELALQSGDQVNKSANDDGDDFDNLESQRQAHRSGKHVHFNPLTVNVEYGSEFGIIDTSLGGDNTKPLHGSQVLAESSSIIPFQSELSPVQGAIGEMQQTVESFSRKVERMQIDLEMQQAQAASQAALDEARRATVANCIKMFAQRAVMAILSRTFLLWQRQTTLKRERWSRASGILRNTAGIVAQRRCLLIWHIRARNLALAKQERTIQLQFGIQQLFTVLSFSREKHQRR